MKLPAIIAAEALNRRRTLIEDGHQGGPSYEGAENFLRIRENTNGSPVDPALFAANRQVSKAELLKKTRLVQEKKKFSRKGNGKDGNEEKEKRGKFPGKP